ncbi:MAG: TlpA disulfide reductase family protein [Myxococcota bacterium]
MIALLLLGCTSSPPKPKPKPVPVEEPEAKPEPVTITLSPGDAWGAVTVSGRTWPEISGTPKLVPHPEAEKLGAYVVTPYGEELLAIAFDGGAKDSWTVSADLNHDGKVLAAEFVDLTAESPTGVLRTVMKRGRPTVDVPIAIHVSASSAGGSPTFTHRIETSRVGSIPCEACEPEGDVAIQVGTFGGLFDTPRAQVFVDGDGDGKPDLDNLLNSFTVAEGVLAARGQRWTFVLGPDGNTITVTATDPAEPIPGLRAGAPAPDLSLPGEPAKTLADFAGKPLLLDFASAACVACAELQPEIAAFAKRHDIVVQGISPDLMAPPPPKRGAKKAGPPWPVAMLGPGNAVATAYGVKNGPMHALIDAEGKLLAIGSLAVVRKAMGETP